MVELAKLVSHFSYIYFDQIVELISKIDFLGQWKRGTSCADLWFWFICPGRMSTTARKRQRFVSEPVGDKDVTELPGISEVLGTRLKDQGYDKVDSGSDIGVYVGVKGQTKNLCPAAVFPGQRGPVSVPAAEERPGAVRRVAERRQRCKQASG